MAATRSSGMGRMASLFRRENGQTESSSFKNLLDQLSAAHSQEVETVRSECRETIRTLKDEVASLRARLGEAGISVDDVKLIPERASWRSRKASGEHTDADDINHDNTLESDHDQGDQGGEAAKGFEVRKEWLRKIDTNTWGKKLDSLIRLKAAQTGTDTHHTIDTFEMMETEQGLNEDEGCRQKKNKWIINPTSSPRLYWDIMGLFLIGYDVFTIPFISAFQPGPSIFSDFMDWAALLFWTGDMFQGFFLGYYDQGYLVQDNRQIVCHYLKSWFVVDLVVVGPEWLILVAGGMLQLGGNQVNSFGKVVKGARAVRVLRLLRLLKLQRIMNLVYDLIESEWTFIVVNLTKMLFFVVVLNHVIACLWFLIGRLSWESDIRNWIEVGNVNGTELAYSYTTSLHWSLTQFTPASMDISARNTWERIFSIIVLFFALVTFSSIVASITGSTTSLRNMKTDEMKQFWLLRRYLRQRKVSSDLSNRIFRFLEHHLRIQNKLVQRDSIKILSGLSEALNNEMTHQMNSPALLKHPLFLNIDANMKVIMTKICRYALKVVSCAEQETIFSWGDVAKKMYFVKAGCLSYTRVDGSSMYPPPRAKEWASEPVLWSSWRHQGDLVAEDNSELILVDPIVFMDMMAVHPRPWLFAKHYAVSFVNMLNSIERLELSDFMRNKFFYDQAVREAEDMFNSEEQRKTMIQNAVSDGGIIFGYQTSMAYCEQNEEAVEGEEGKEGEGQVQRYKSTYSLVREDSKAAVVTDTAATPHAEQPQPRLLRFCPCTKGVVPMCLP